MVPPVRQADVVAQRVFCFVDLVANWTPEDVLCRRVHVGNVGLQFVLVSQYLVTNRTLATFTSTFLPRRPWKF